MIGKAAKNAIRFTSIAWLSTIIIGSIIFSLSNSDYNYFFIYLGFGLLLSLPVFLIMTPINLKLSKMKNELVAKLFSMVINIGLAIFIFVVMNFEINEYVFAYFVPLILAVLTVRLKIKA